MKNDTQTLRKCAECGNTYTPKRKNNIYCSGKCADKVYNRKRRAKAAETAREWRKNNAERAHATAKAYRKANLRKETERMRRWIGRNPERFKQSVNRWIANNPEKVRTAQHRRSKAELEGNATPALIKAKWEASNKICYLCGGPIDPNLPSHHRMARTIDHIAPIARGGRHDLDNIDFAHRSCNSSKKDKPLEEWQKRNRQSAR